MKKLILLAAAAGLSFCVQAQRVSNGSSPKPANMASTAVPTAWETSARTTASGDTVSLSNTTTADTPTLYWADTSTAGGFVSGTDEYGDMGFAERYDFGTADSSLKVVGVIALFGGKVNPASTKTVTFYTWNVAPVSAMTGVAGWFNSGLPNTALDSVTVPITHLGIPAVDTLADTFKSFFFTTPTGYLDQSFFVGYQINYSYAALGGDTIGLYTSQDGSRSSALYTVAGPADTIANNQNATLYNDGSGWHDNGEDNFFMANDFYIYPIVIVHEKTAGVGITKNNLTFFGNYPNPAVSSTDVTFSLATSAGVTLQVTDMAGRVITTIKQANLAAGNQNININTSDMPAGDYIYLLRTTEGDGFAGKLTVAK